MHDGPATIAPAGRGAIFLTGATGFLGMELLARYLERTDRHVYALVRPSDATEPSERLRGVIAEVSGDPDAYRGRWSAVRGDAEVPGLGIEPGRMRELAAQVSDIVHSAASVSFSLPLDQSRRINVAGTRRVLEFAELCRERGGLRRFAYVSTAYVAGDHRGCFSEGDLDVGQDFRNSYERSKFEAERLVRERTDALPVQIFRPSIIVGEQSSGWTASFNVLYPPLKGFEAGAYPALPARPDTPVDVVPVDYVADAIFELAERRPAERGETHHLVAGERATTVGRLAERAGRYFRRRPPLLLPPQVYRLLIHPLLAAVSRGRRRRALRRTESLFPYFSMRVRFDDRRSRALLESVGIRPPRPESYLDRLLDFAVAARWGKRRVTRAEAHRFGGALRRG
jgi:thioester reductase-like protein